MTGIHGRRRFAIRKFRGLEYAELDACPAIEEGDAKREEWEQGVAG